MDWKAFKSGTDVRGIASDGVAGEPVTLTDEVVGAISLGFAKWLSEKTGKSVEELRIGVGHDCRISSDRIDNAVCSALKNTGAHVVSAGMSSTPAMFMMTLDCSLDGSIQITASHHPFNRNGLKFFTPEGGLEGSDISAILLSCESNNLPVACAGGTIEKIDYMPQYAARLRDMIKKEVAAQDYDKPLAGFKLAVDAGNGVGGFYAVEVLEKLGADVSGSRYLEPDGMFPNHAPNPENKQAMDSLREAVMESGADLGVIFDTDVDRAGAVDKNGEEINRNRLIALAAAIALEDNDGGTIVTDSTTSAGIKTFIEQLGGKHYRYRRGYRNVIVRAQELNEQGINCPLAIETSGHAALRENYFLDDGAYLVTKIIIRLAQLRSQGKELSELTASLPVPQEEYELRLPIVVPNFRECGELILNQLISLAERYEYWQLADDNREGVRVTLPNEDGWFLLRLSVHDPIMPLNLESNREGGCAHIARQLLIALEGCGGLDLSPLKKFCC